MRDGPPEVYRMPRCRNCPRYCKPCLTVEEANDIQANHADAKLAGDNMVWNMQTICDACHRKSNRRQNEIIAEKVRHGKPKGKLAQIQALLDALDECEKVGYVMNETEVAQLNAKMKALGIG